jgi:purine-binding chemotaxis protein CheW
MKSDKIVPFEEKDVIEVLCFSLHDEVYGVDVLCVEEVVKVRDVTPLPVSPPFIIGITSLRGTVIPVMDLSTRLGLSKCKGNKMVVLSSNNRIFSILVDEILYVTSFNQASLEPAPPYIRGGEFIKGLGRHRDKDVVIILDADMLADFGKT